MSNDDYHSQTEAAIRNHGTTAEWEAWIAPDDELSDEMAENWASRRIDNTERNLP